MKWSFHNPTTFTAATIGKDEEEAIADIVATFGAAPEFRIDDVHVATEEELQEMAGEVAVPSSPTKQLLN